MNVIKNVLEISRIICNKKQAQQAVYRQPIYIANVDHDYIIDKIGRHNHIKHEIQIQNNDK